MNRTHFEQHVLYHDAIDQREARERAENAEIDDLAAQYEARAAKEMSESIASSDPETIDEEWYPGSFYAPAMCCCAEHAGDNDDCQIHGLTSQPCTCGPNPDAPACPSCGARADLEEMPF